MSEFNNMNYIDMQDFTNNSVLTINKKLKKLAYNVVFNTGSILILLSLVLGMYAGGFIITGNIMTSVVNAKSQIQVFSSQIGGIAQAADLLVNICNKPQIAPFCKNDTMLLNLI